MADRTRNGVATSSDSRPRNRPGRPRRDRLRVLPDREGALRSPRVLTSCQPGDSLDDLWYPRCSPSRQGRLRVQDSVTTVLLVDDHADSLEMYVLALELNGFRAVTATSAEAGYAQALDLRPDVVITDVTLPAGSGLDLVRRLRQAPETSETGIILLTGHTAPQIELEAREAGCDRYLMKPIGPDDLSLAIREVLGARPAAQAGR